MVHQDIKIDATVYSRGQREESQHYERKVLVTRLTPEVIMLGGNTDGMSFRVSDLLRAIEVIDQSGPSPHKSPPAGSDYYH